MKYKKMQAKLQGRIGWWQNQSDAYKRAHKCPGSVKLQ